MILWFKRMWNHSIIFKKDNELTNAQKWGLGLFNLASVVIFWVMSSFLVSDLFESDIYRKPFLITYLNTACFSFYIIPYLKFEKLSIKQFISIVRKELNEKRIDIEAASYGSNDSDENVQQTDTASSPLMNHTEIVEGETLESNKNLDIGILETIKLSLTFVALWFSANLVTNSSLSYTSVASQTILSSTSSFFTLIVGFIYSVERINKSKIYGIILCFTGVLIVTNEDSATSNPTNSTLMVFIGNMLALSGALIYGIYTILLKAKTIIKNSHVERNLNAHLFFAFVGLFCLFLLWPIIIILHFTGIEEFALPTDRHTLTLLLINMLITFVSDFCWCKAVILTSPLTVTVGLSLTIPLAMVGDWIIKQFKFNWIYATGATIVTIGFLIINQDEKNDHDRNL